MFKQEVLIIKQAFIALLSFSGSLADMFNASSFTTCTSLNNHSFIFIPTIIDLTLNEYKSRLCCYPFMINVDIYNGSCNSLDDLSV